MNASTAAPAATATGRRVIPMGLALALLVVMALIGAYDVWAAFTLAPGHTVSELVQSWAVRFPILPFALGLLCGHLFWPLGRRG